MQLLRCYNLTNSSITMHFLLSFDEFLGLPAKPNLMGPTSWYITFRIKKYFFKTVRELRSKRTYNKHTKKKRTKSLLCVGSYGIDQ